MVNQWLNDNMDDLRRLRRWLHQHPEIGFDEHKTSKYLQQSIKNKSQSSPRDPSGQRPVFDVSFCFVELKITPK